MRRRPRSALPTPAEAALARKQLTVPSEGAFQRQVIEYAELRGWRCFSIPDSRRATARGWPDLTMRHDGGRAAPLNRLRLAVCELKDDDYQPTDDQIAWLDALSAVARHANASAGYEIFYVGLWRPCVFDELRAYLEGAEWSRVAA